MKTMRSRSLFWPSIITAAVAINIIAAALFAYFSTFPKPVANVGRGIWWSKRDHVKWYLGCQKILHDPIPIEKEKVPFEEWYNAYMCETILEVIDISEDRQIEGGFVEESLKVLFNNNQTAVDIELCARDSHRRRCTDEIERLIHDYYDSDYFERAISSLNLSQLNLSHIN